MTTTTQLAVQAAARGILRKSLRSARIRRMITGRKPRRSDAFMDAVSSHMDCGYTFIEAVRAVSEDSTILAQRSERKGEAHRQQALMDHWNATVPVGTPIVIWDAFTPETVTRTRSAAWMVSGHPSVLVGCKSGSWSLEFARVAR